MASKKKSPLAVKKRSIIQKSLSEWNFVIFLTLSFILLVFVALSMQEMSLDLRARALGNRCGKLTQLPVPEDCPGGRWQYERDSRGCPAFVCNPEPLRGNPEDAPGRQQ